MVQWQSLLPSTRLRSIGKNIISRFSSRKLTALSETKTKRHLPDRRQNGFIMFSCTSSKSWWVIARLLVWIFPELPVFNILLASCRRGFLKKKKRKKRRQRAHGSNNSNYHKSKWTYYHNSHSDSVFFYLCAWGGGGAQCSEPFLPISITLSLSAGKPSRTRKEEQWS